MYKSLVNHNNYKCYYKNKLKLLTAKVVVAFGYNDPGQIMVVYSLLKRHFSQAKVNSIT